MSSFECQQIRVQLAAFLEDGISEAERIIVRLHLQNCPGCQREMEVLQCVPLIVKEWQPEVPTRTMWVYIEQRIKIPQGVSERARVKPPRVPLQRKWLGWGGALVAGAAAATLAFFLLTPHPEPTIPIDTQVVLQPEGYLKQHLQLTGFETPTEYYRLTEF